MSFWGEQTSLARHAWGSTARASALPPALTPGYAPNSSVCLPHWALGQFVGITFKSTSSL